MDINNLIKLLKTIINHPEVITTCTEKSICGIIGEDDTFFRIKICCEGSGVTLMMSDTSEVNFDLHEENKEIFDTLFKEAKDKSREYKYNKLLEEISKYENSCCTSINK